MRRRVPSPKSGPEATAASLPFIPPYPPSWVDRVTEAVDRVPGPAWLTFVALGAAGVLLQLAIQQATSDYQVGPFLPFQVWVNGNFAYLLAMVYYLDRSAAASLETFRPLLELPPPMVASQPQHQGYADLHYRLTTLPARTTAWVGVVGGLVLGAIPLALIGGPAGSLWSPTRMLVGFGLSAAPAALVATLAQFFATQAIAASVAYHTIHQLRLINHIYLKHSRVNLYRLQPLYAFSVLAALTSGGLLLYSYLWFATAPELRNEPASLALGTFFSGIAILTFTWPLWGIHRRLVAEKARLLQQSSSRFEAVVAQLHQRVDRQRLARMDDLNKTLASLEIEQAALRRIPTWPWEPGTVRGLAAALLVPLVLWLTQTILERLMG